MERATIGTARIGAHAGGLRRSRGNLHLKLHAVDDAEHDGREAILVGFRGADDLSDQGHVVGAEAAAEPVDQELFGQRLHEDIRPFQERLAQPVHAVDLVAVGEHVGGLDRHAALVAQPPRAHGVEVLEREPDRVHQAVTGGTGGVRPVLLHLLPHRARRARGLAFGQRGHVGRGHRRRRPEHVLEHPLASQHRRRGVGVGGDHQYRALAQQPTAGVVGQPHLPELAAEHAGDVVVPGQSFVHERVVARQQLEHALVLAQDAAKEQLGFTAERLPQVVVEVGEQVRVRHDAAQIAQVQPLAREVGDQRLGPRIGHHPAHLPRQHLGPAEPAFVGQLQQLVVGDAAPEEERQTRGQLEVVDVERAARRLVRRLPFSAEDKGRRGQDAAERKSDPALERARAAPLAVERQQSLSFVGRQRPSVRPAGHRREDPGGARLLVRGARGSANEQPRARWVGRLRAVEGPLDRDRLDVRGALRIKGIREVADETLQPIRLEQRRHLLEEGGGHGVPAGLDRQAHAQPRCLELVAGVGGILLQRNQILVATDAGEQLPLPVNRQLDLMRILEPADRAEVGAIQPHLELVLAVGRKHVLENPAADRAERQSVEMMVLREVLAHRVGGAVGAPRLAGRQGADPSCRCEVRLQQRRRASQRVRDVVEPEGGVVGRQQRGDIHIESQQIADGVGILGPIQAVQHAAPRPRLPGHGRVEAGFKRGDGPLVGRGIGPARPQRRHHAQPQLANHLFPGVRVRAHVVQLQRVDRESASGEPLIVAADTVLGERRLGRGMRVYRLASRRRLGLPGTTDGRAAGYKRQPEPKAGECAPASRPESPRKHSCQTSERRFRSPYPVFGNVPFRQLFA